MPPVAIDFAKLLREEREKRRARSAGDSNGTVVAAVVDPPPPPSSSSSSSPPLPPPPPFAKCFLLDPSPPPPPPPPPPLPPSSLSLSLSQSQSQSQQPPHRLCIRTVCQDPPLLRYHKRLLSEEYASYLVRWILRLPLLSKEGEGVEGKEEAKGGEGRCSRQQRRSRVGWNHLWHARRRVAVIELSEEQRQLGQSPPNDNNNGDDGDGDDEKEKEKDAPCRASSVSKDNADEDRLLASSSSSSSSSAWRAALEPLASLLSSSFFPEECPINHVLVNAYPRGAAGRRGRGRGGGEMVTIMPHTDGPAYHPITCTVSLGRAVTLRFQRIRRHEEEPEKQKQPPRPADADDGTKAAETSVTTAATANANAAAATSSSLEEKKKKDRENAEVATADASIIRLRLSGRGSLAVFSEDLYSKYLHSIEQRPSSCGGGRKRRGEEGRGGWGRDDSYGRAVVEGFDGGLDSHSDPDACDSSDSATDFDLGVDDDDDDVDDPEFSPPERISITLRHKYRCCLSAP